MYSLIYNFANFEHKKVTDCSFIATFVFLILTENIMSCGKIQERKIK